MLSRSIGSVNTNNNVTASEQNLHLELGRLKTFTNCIKIPISRADEMATLGFYYSLSDNVIKCSSCVNFVSDIASKEYLNHKCSMVKRDTMSNVANAPAPTNCSSNIVVTVNKPSRRPLNEYIGNQRTKWLHYSNYNNRMTSYRGWSIPFQKAEDLSEAGLFFLDGRQDTTVCFHCGIGIRNWTRDDVPWKEHAKYSPDCNFVLQVKGKDFVDKAWIKKLKPVPRMKPEDFDLYELSGTPRPQANNIAKEKSSIDERYACKVCYSKECDMLFFPCMHLCACNCCSSKLIECVICRCPIEKQAKIYRS